MIFFAFFVAVAAQGTVGPAFSLFYTSTSLGSVPGVPSQYGGITFKDANTLLIGGAANSGSGAIYSIAVTRDVGGHVNGFVGSASLYATAPDIDGGLTFGPGGVLFFTKYSDNQLGEIKPGSTSPDKTVALGPLGIASSVGTIAIVPPGSPGAGSVKIASYGGGGVYDVVLTADGTGTYDVTSAVGAATTGSGPEGLVYVPPGSPVFASPSMLISEYGAGRISAYNIDANGNPIVSSRQDFITGLTGAEGATVDPATGDLLFSTFGGGSKVILVQGFATPISPTE